MISDIAEGQEIVPVPLLFDASSNEQEKAVSSIKARFHYSPVNIFPGDDLIPSNDTNNGCTCSVSCPLDRDCEWCCLLYNN